MNRKYCDLCGGEIIDGDFVSISVFKRTQAIYISGKDLHINCANRLFSTDFNIIFNSFKK